MLANQWALSNMGQGGGVPGSRDAIIAAIDTGVDPAPNCKSRHALEERGVRQDFARVLLVKPGWQKKSVSENSLFLPPFFCQPPALIAIPCASQKCDGHPEESG